MNRKIAWLVASSVFSALVAVSPRQVKAQTAGEVDGVGVATGADAVLEWNVNMLQAISTATPNGLFHSRWAAIVHVAMHDAVVSFTRDAEPYTGIRITPPAGGSIEAAAIAAAHFALVALLPAQQPKLDSLFASSLAARGLTASDPGVGTGESVAAHVLALRASDGAASAQFPFTAPGAGSPGVWVATPPAFAPALLPGWLRVTPWAMRRGSQFRLGPPPEVNSDLYVRDVNEVMEVGALHSNARTSLQTDLARWWTPSAVIIWNPIAHQVVAARGLSISRAARLFALLNIAAADGAIACWDSKYTYNHWRPISAIRSADGLRITPDPTWVPFLVTPPFPEYPSAHNEISGAMAQILISLFGDRPGPTIIAHSPAHPTFDHPWTRFSEGIDEVINARVWEGIHFRNSDQQGMRAGRCVGQFVVRHTLRHHGDGEADDENGDHDDADLDCGHLGRLGDDGHDDGDSR